MTDSIQSKGLYESTLDVEREIADFYERKEDKESRILSKGMSDSGALLLVSLLTCIWAPPNWFILTISGGILSALCFIIFFIMWISSGVDPHDM